MRFSCLTSKFVWIHQCTLVECPDSSSSKLGSWVLPHAQRAPRWALMYIPTACATAAPVALTDCKVRANVGTTVFATCVVQRTVHCLRSFASCEQSGTSKCASVFAASSMHLLFYQSQGSAVWTHWSLSKLISLIFQVWISMHESQAECRGKTNHKFVPVRGADSRGPRGMTSNERPKNSSSCHWTWSGDFSRWQTFRCKLQMIKETKVMVLWQQWLQWLSSAQLQDLRIRTQIFYNSIEGSILESTKSQCPEVSASWCRTCSTSVRNRSTKSDRNGSRSSPARTQADMIADLVDTWTSCRKSCFDWAIGLLNQRSAVAENAWSFLRE